MNLTYQEITKLGSGASGNVYSIKIRLPNSEKLYALKRVCRNMTSGYSTIREIIALRNLTHPNIIECSAINFGDSKARTEIIMPLYEQNLRNFMESVSMFDRIKLLWRLVTQMCSAVQYMHSRGFVHRDVKPDNILVSLNNTNILGSCQFVLADLGLAKQISLDLGNAYYSDVTVPDLVERYQAASDGDIAYQQHTQEVCTLNYRSPELIDHSHEYIYYSGAIDIWSLGCTFYEYITRKFLFCCESEKDLLRSINLKIETNWDIFLKVEINRCICQNLINAKPLLSVIEKFIDLIPNMIVLDPKKRITSSSILQDYIETTPIKPEISYFLRTKLKYVSSDLRDIYVMNIIDVLHDYDLNLRTILLAVDLFDLYISHSPVILDYALISQTCVYMASKTYDFVSLRVDQVTTVYSKVEIASTEKNILETIDFNIPAYTIIDLMETWTFIKPSQRLIFAHDETISETVLEFISEYDNLESRNINSIRETLWALI